ncbi:hypothetical protein AB6A40_006003 [Gnathostoma spinigerum]|uniref:Uncharacterized protein n=1 Tax=Gnathostoma spinigerum TaxID=75299 RepID=A0ABD6EPR7_9BILA
MSFLRRTLCCYKQSLDTGDIVSPSQVSDTDETPKIVGSPTTVVVRPLAWQLDLSTVYGEDLEKVAESRPSPEQVCFSKLHATAKYVTFFSTRNDDDEYTKNSDHLETMF